MDRTHDASSNPSVLLVDDGELAPFCELLEELGGSVEHFRGGVMEQDIEHFYDLVLTNVKQSAAVATALQTAGMLGKCVWLVIHPFDFLPLRERLRDLGVQYLIHSKVDPTVFQLLCLHSLYRGAENRGEPRLLAGSKISFRCEGEVWPATLLDLTADSCSLATRNAPPEGARLDVMLPASLSGSEEIVQEARVLRVERKKWAGRSGVYLVGVRIPRPRASWRRTWRAIQQCRNLGTRVTRLAEDARALASEQTEQSCERRQGKRGAYPEWAFALTGGGNYVILCRDLSVGGVRLEPGSDLEVGTQFELSIYGASGEEPLVLQARVLRDDGPQGFAVTFEDLAPETRQRIEQLVAGLPKIESLKGEEAVPGALVVATAAPADAADRGER